jgi:A/G-specific adenine glycosylase
VAKASSGRSERAAAEHPADDAALDRILARERRFIAQLPAEAPAALAAAVFRRFRAIVVDHYRCCGRDLEWRRTFDPYRILVSEVMLQQTQVPRVAVKYPSFVARFPDFAALAAASLGEVLEEWQGMGYNRRALQLKRAAEEVVERHGGELPADLEAIDALPGIGHATAAAVMAMAFCVPVAYIETNVRAVMLHFFFHDHAEVPDRDVMPVVEATLDRRDPRQWYYALMDYGTWLKKREVNPSRRSRHHAVQAPYAGSMRQVRGKVLRALVGAGGRTTEQLAASTALSEERVAEALQAYEREGFVGRADDRWFIRD